MVKIQLGLKKFKPGVSVSLGDLSKGKYAVSVKYFEMVRPSQNPHSFSWLLQTALITAQLPSVF